MVSERDMLRACLGVLALSLPGCDDTVADVVVGSDSGTDSDTDADTDSDSDTDTDSDTDSDVPMDIVHAHVWVPEYFDDYTVCLTTSFYSPDHMPPVGPPNGMGEPFPNPVMEPPPFDLLIPQPDIDGLFYVVIRLLVHGDSCDVAFMPGTDWRWDSPEPILIGPGTGTINLGEIHLQK